MAWTYHYGTTTGTASSKFRVFVRTEITAWALTGCTVKYQYGIQVTAGNFKGSIVNTSWSGNYSVILNGTGIVGIGTENTVNVNYGATKAFTANASYTGGSGTTYKSTLSFTFPAQYPTVGFYSSSGAWKSAIPYVYSGGAWKPCMAALWSSSGKWRLVNNI